jgi:hypothetical protein
MKDTDDDPIEDLKGAFDDIGVPIGEGIEGAGEHRGHLSPLSTLSFSYTHRAPHRTVTSPNQHFTSGFPHPAGLTIIPAGKLFKD